MSRNTDEKQSAPELPFGYVPSWPVACEKGGARKLTFGEYPLD